MTGRAIAASLSKELRALLPLWMASMLVVGAAYLTPGRGIGFTLALLAYIGGSIALGAFAVGHEYVNRTIETLLVLPLARRSILATKLAIAFVLWVVLVIVCVQTILHGPQREAFRSADAILLLGLFTFAVAPTFTLLSRNVVAGAVFTIAVPAFVWFAGDLAGLAIHGAGQAAAIDAFRAQAFRIVLLIVGGVAAVALWILFPAQEAVESHGGEFHLPWRSAAEKTLTRRAPLGQLLAKELRLQQLTFVVAAFYVLGVLATVMTAGAQGWAPTYVLEPITAFYASMVAVLAGAMASAEERHYGTWQQQMLLPVAVWRQWLVKVLAVLTLSGGVAVGLPWLLSETVPSLGRLIPAAALPVAAVILVTAASLYVSTLSRSGIRALVASVAALLGTWTFAVSLHALLSRTFRSLAPAMFRQVNSPLRGHLRETDVLLVIASVLIVTLLTFAYWNHRADGRSARGVAGQVIALAVLVVASVLVVILGL